MTHRTVLKYELGMYKATDMFLARLVLMPQKQRDVLSCLIAKATVGVFQQ